MLQDKLQPFINRHEEINELLISPEITSDIKRMTELAKEQSSIAPIVNKAIEYIQVLEDIEENKMLLDDNELGELAKEELKDLDVEIVSYTVDPKNDDIERLKWYATSNEINTENWNFVTGNQHDIYELGVNGYFLPNQEDALAPGGFLHSEKIVLLDKMSRIRGWYDGTDLEEVKKLIKDAKTLLIEK